MKFILAKLREMLFAHPKVLLPRVRLIGFNEDSLKVEILAYTDTGVWAEWHAIREDVFLRVMQIVESSGIRLALPSQTTYFVRDDGLDNEGELNRHTLQAAGSGGGHICSRTLRAPTT